MIILRFEWRVCRWESCRMHQSYAALAQLPEALRSDRRGWGWKSLTRHHFAHVVQCRDGALKTRTVSVQIRPWAPPRVAQGRGVPLKTERLQVQVLSRGPIWPEPESSARGSGQAISWLAVRPRVRRSERQHHFWNVHRSSVPGLGANECVPSGKWCESTAFRSMQTATIARVAQREPAALYPASH